MERLTFRCKYDGSAMLKSGVSHGVLDRLAAYEDAEEQGLLVRLPCGKGAKLMYNGEEYEANHWNILLTATREDATVKAGYRVHLFDQETAKAALK